jgi:hypothetical protein
VHSGKNPPKIVVKTSVGRFSLYGNPEPVGKGRVYVYPLSVVIYSSLSVPLWLRGLLGTLSSTPKIIIIIIIK